MVERLKQLSLYIFLGLLGYMPLHILLSTWIGTSFGVLDFVKMAKDMLLIVGFLAILVCSFKELWFKKWLTDRLTIVIGIYALLHVLLLLVRPTDTDAELLGLVYNTRFLLFFVYGMLLARLYDVQKLKKTSLKIVGGVAVLVLLFGIAQYALLPNDALTHLGYSRTNGVLPAFFIDDKPDLERAMSTLRDPNSFGSYTIITGMLALAFYFKSKNRDLKKVALGLTILSIFGLWFSFSRSAALGFLLATAVVGLTLYKDRIRRHLKLAAVSFGVVLLLGAAMLYPLRNTYFVQNVIFHADSSTKLEDPNQLRVRFIQESVQGIADNPAGYGPGTAGLASIRNEKQGTTLNENYYLQIAHEVGLLGLILFLATLALVGWRLYQASNHTLALALLASFAGLAFTNLLVHIWSNEAVAYTWWGLASLALVDRNSHNKKSKRKLV